MRTRTPWKTKIYVECNPSKPCQRLPLYAQPVQIEPWPHGRRRSLRASAFQPGRPLTTDHSNTTLKLVHFEPHVVPKKSLTGDTTERVDTRVLQVIYSFDRNDLPIFVGQQMDAFIESVDRPALVGTNAAPHLLLGQRTIVPMVSPEAFV
jgi:hypothetical protein